MESVDPKKLHVAIIMDGNGRWAQARGWPRLAGHRAGAQAVERVVEAAVKSEIGTLTLYAFSTENWRRPWPEVSGLMRLLGIFLRRKQKKLSEHGVRLRWLGRRDRVPAPIRQVFETVEQQTADLRKLTLALAVDYGGRWELAQAALQFAAQHGPAALDQPDLERRFAACLPGGWLPDVDLLIRTSGEKRISNFLPWQASYAELYFTPVLWPDFGAADLQTALAWYHRRVRRYGAVAQTVTGVAGGNTSR